MLGKVIFQTTLGVSETSLDVSALQTGIYLLEITTANGGRQLQKLAIKR